MASSEPMVCAAEDSMLPPDAARAASRRLPRGWLVVVPTAGHIGPLLRTPEQLGELLTRFWFDPAATVRRHREPASEPEAGPPPVAIPSPGSARYVGCRGRVHLCAVGCRTGAVLRLSLIHI